MADFTTEGVANTDLSSLTVDKVLESIEELHSSLEKPFKNLLIRNGFDPEVDAIIFSKRGAELHGLDEDNIPPRMKDRIHIDFNNFMPLTEGFCMIRVSEFKGLYDVKPKGEENGNR